MPNKSFYFLNLGCPKNQVDGDVIRGTLRALGYIESFSPEAVDYIFVNTCAFIEQARLETKGEIEQILNYKNKHAKLIALGCYPALADMKNEIPVIDASFRFDQTANLYEYLTGSKDYCHKLPALNRAIDGWPYSYVVISDGCDNRCSYCTIPNIRGPYRSRKPSEIIAEVKYLAFHGSKEIVLVAQDTAIYGKDLSEKIDLPELCRLIAEINGVEWIRVMYAHPAHLDETMLDRLFGIAKVVRYLDMPLQHISDNMLKSMRRHCDAAKIRRLINHLHSIDKNISLRTTLMVGFPGETDDDFRQLVDFVEEAHFDYLGAFVYSPEMNTAAYDMPGKVDSELAQQRYELLSEIAEETILAKAEAQIGKTETLLIDGISPDAEDLIEARSYRQAPEIDGVYNLQLSEEIESVKFVKAEITAVDFAEIIE